MNKTLISELSKLEDFEFINLEHHFSVARSIRDTMTKNGIDEKLMAEKIGVPVKKMKQVINGAYPFDLRLLSKLHSYQHDLASINTKNKIEAESIGFVNYKNQYPLYVDRIERLLNILEKEKIEK